MTRSTKTSRPRSTLRARSAALAAVLLASASLAVASHHDSNGVPRALPMPWYHGG